MLTTNFDITFNGIVLVKSLADGEADTSTIIAEYIHGNENFTALSHHLFQNSINSSQDFRELIEELTIGANKGLRPILNIDCHGSEYSGLAFKDKSTMSWDEVANCLRPLNEANELNLIVIFSCCFGAWFLGDMGIIKAAPCAYVIGPTEGVYSGEIIAGLIAFYDSLFRTFNVVEAAKQLREGSLCEGSWFTRSAGEWYPYIAAKYIEEYCTRVQRRKNVAEVFQRHAAEGNSQRHGQRSMSGIKRDLAAVNRKYLSHTFFDAYFMIDKLPSHKQRFGALRTYIELEINKLRISGKYSL